MEMWMLIGELMHARTRDYLATSPLDPECMPGLRPPATSVQIEALETLAGQPLDPDYRKFLSLTDGLDGFQFTMPLLGCCDWERPERSGLASMFRDIILEAGPLDDVGLPEETHVFPVFVNRQGSAGALMLHASDAITERYWWTGSGDSRFFHTFHDLVAYMAGQ